MNQLNVRGIFQGLSVWLEVQQQRGQAFLSRAVRNRCQVPKMLAQSHGRVGAVVEEVRTGVQGRICVEKRYAKGLARLRGDFGSLLNSSVTVLAMFSLRESLVRKRVPLEFLEVGHLEW